MLKPSWSDHSSLWPPPGAMTTAAPVAVSLEGRYTITEGRWMLEVTCSPCGVMRTASGAVFPSDPGAPLGQRKTTGGSSAIPREHIRKKAHTIHRLEAVFI